MGEVRVVYKYPLNLMDGLQAVTLPQGSKIVSVGMQYGIICMWALVNTAAVSSLRQFRIYGTGQPVDESQTLTHVGTILDGSFVWHVFEVVP